MTSDGHRLRESWSSALNDALESFRSHLTSGNSSSWKRVPYPAKAASGSSEAKGRLLPRLDLSDVLVHRKSTKTGDIYRAVAELTVDNDVGDLDAWRAVLIAPELRKEWDPAVESSSVLEMFDPVTRIVKTKFTLGWPVNPRDAVMIARTFSDSTTVIDVSTSLPRSQDEPSYLRPAPPYVRSRVDLFAWCIKLFPSNQATSNSGEKLPARRGSGSARLRITCFWHHDLRTVWNIGAPSNLSQQLCATVMGLLETVQKRRTRITTLKGYGVGVSIERVSYDIGREALSIDYAVLPEGQELNQHIQALHGLDELHILKEQRRLRRSIEFTLPSTDGWDIRVSTRASSTAVSQLPWTSRAYLLPADTGVGGLELPEKVCFQIQHSALFDDHSILRVRIMIEYSGSLKGIRLDGLPHSVDAAQSRDPVSYSMSNQLVQDASSAVATSMNTGASIMTVESDASSMSTPRKPALLRTNSNVSRPPAVDKSILTRVRRTYIYFSSLLQEPEAKWKRNTEARGVSVTQLDSIDPTLVVYKAEATFVGISLWDLYSAVITPGARIYWDKQYDDATLIEDVNELSELWYYKSKPAWPVAGRDTVLLKTVYKSPSTIHVFLFSVDDPVLFPNIPPTDLNLIRTQVDLQGWAIEALSPNTTLLTLLEQSDPKGWSGKSSIPQQMISLVAGVGEFAIKCGGPPIVSRLSGAKADSLRYEHERGVFRVEYEAASSRRASPPYREHRRQNSTDSVDLQLSMKRDDSTSSVECELRCDIDTWTTSLDIVVDPPPQNITCLRRHRFSTGGGGLWLTVGHDIALSAEERLLVIVRRAPFTANREKGIVMLNGKRIGVDVEELPEAERNPTKQKRVKPVRIPLDQPPVLGVIRRRRPEINAEATPEAAEQLNKLPKSPPNSTAPKFSSPLSTFFFNAMEQARTTTQQTVAALSPPPVVSSDVSFPPGKMPMHFALDALAFAQGYHRGSFGDNWIPIVDKGLQIHRRHSPEISPTIPVHKGEKVIEGVTAEEVANVIVNYDCRKHWDDRFDSVTVFEEYGSDCHSAFLVTKGGFPFRDRGFYLASLTARGSQVINPVLSVADGPQSPTGIPNAIYCVSSSFNPDSMAAYSPTGYNSYSLPIGRMFVDAWILETLDPYTAENYQIPSTRCTKLVAVDYAGSIPVAVNSMINSALPRAVLAVEIYLKGLSPFPEMRLPASGFRVAAYDSNDISGSAWTLTKPSEERTLLASKIISAPKIFRGSVLISFQNPTSGVSSPDLEQDTPTIAQEEIPSRPTSPVSNRRTRVDSMPSPGPVERHRRISSASVTMSLPRSLGLRSLSRDVLRSTSSTFTIGRDFKAHFPSDFVVAEVVVDLRLYPDGYEVQLSSRIVQAGGSARPLPITSINADAESATLNTPPEQAASVSSLAVSAPPDQASTSPTSAQDTERAPASVLPLAHSVVLLPPSPLHTSISSSGSNTDVPVCHLLRLTLPTAQYHLPTIEDPLTGEIRSAPPKPDWYRELDEEGKAAVVCIEIRPLAEAMHKKGRRVVCVDGTFVNVAAVDNMRSLEVAGAEGLGLLARTSLEEGGDPLPEQLTTPLSVADHLYESATVVAGETTPLPEGGDLHVDTAATDQDAVSESPASITPVDNKGTLDATSAASSDPKGISAGAVIPSAENQASQGLFTFSFMPLLRFASIATTTAEQTSRTDSPTSSSPASQAASRLRTLPGGFTRESSPGTEKADSKGGTRAPTPTPAADLPKPASTDPSGDMQGRPATTADAVTTPNGGARQQQQGYSLATLLATALIAFLLGSLLRSLLSPADFIYVVSDLRDAAGVRPLSVGATDRGATLGGGGGGEVGLAQGGQPMRAFETGWREIRRLLEVKYIVGGWDFQVAVVRRH